MPLQRDLPSDLPFQIAPPQSLPPFDRQFKSHPAAHGIAICSVAPTGSRWLEPQHRPRPTLSFRCRLCLGDTPASLECVECGTLQIDDNRVIIGLIKRLHLREELFDAEKKRIHSEKFHVIGRMASPHWYCRTRDRFEMIRPA
jgi:hypothetical protein